MCRFRLLAMLYQQHYQSDLLRAVQRQLPAHLLENPQVRLGHEDAAQSRTAENHLHQHNVHHHPDQMITALPAEVPQLFCSPDGAKQQYFIAPLVLTTKAPLGAAVWRLFLVLQRSSTNRSNFRLFHLEKYQHCMDANRLKYKMRRNSLCCKANAIPWCTMGKL